MTALTPATIHVHCVNSFTEIPGNGHARTKQFKQWQNLRYGHLISNSTHHRNFWGVYCLVYRHLSYSVHGLDFTLHHHNLAHPMIVVYTHRLICCPHKFFKRIKQNSWDTSVVSSTAKSASNFLIFFYHNTPAMIEFHLSKQTLVSGCSTKVLFD